MFIKKMGDFWRAYLNFWAKKWRLHFEKIHLPYLNLLKHSLMRAACSPLVFTWSLNSLPVDMRFHSKYSDNASAFSCLWLPGGPIRNTRRPKKSHEIGVKIQIFGVLMKKGRDYVLLVVCLSFLSKNWRGSSGRATMSCFIRSSKSS